MPTKRAKLPRTRVVRGNAGAKPRPAAIPLDPPGFVPVTRDDMTDLALLPQAFRMFVATNKADFDWLKENIKIILAELSSLKRGQDRHEERIRSHDQRLDDHEKRLSALEAQTPQGEARKGQDQ